MECAWTRYASLLTLSAPKIALNLFCGCRFEAASRSFLLKDGMASFRSSQNRHVWLRRKEICLVIPCKTNDGTTVYLLWCWDQLNGIIFKSLFLIQCWSHSVKIKAQSGLTARCIFATCQVPSHSGPTLVPPGAHSRVAGEDASNERHVSTWAARRTLAAQGGWQGRMRRTSGTSALGPLVRCNPSLSATCLSLPCFITRYKYWNDFNKPWIRH